MKIWMILRQAALMLLVLCSGAHGDTLPCEVVTGGDVNGSGFTAMRRGDEYLIYRVSGGSKDWLVKGFGWHATAAVQCRDCSGVSAKIKAVIWLRAGQQITEKPDIMPGQDMPHSSSFTWYETRYDREWVRSAPSPVAIGQFEGWLLPMTASSKGVVTHDVIEVIASDGCGFMNVRMEAPPSPTGKPIDAVYGLLRSIHVSVTDARADPLWRSIKDQYAKFSPLKKLTFDEFRRAIGAAK